MMLNIPNIETNRIMLNVTYPNHQKTRLRTGLTGSSSRPAGVKTPKPREANGTTNPVCSSDLPPSYIYLFTDKQIPFTNIEHPEQPDWSSHS